MLCKTQSFLNQIPANSNICIYGTNNIAEKLYDEISTYRKDLKVQFFLDSNKEGFLKDLPVYRADKLCEHIKEINLAIIASFAHANYLEIILKGFGLQNVYKINADSFYELSYSLNSYIDISKAVDVFKTTEDKMLYKTIYEAKYDDRKKQDVRNYFADKHKEKIRGNGKDNTYSVSHYFEFINKDAIKTVIDAGGYDGLFSVIFTQKFPNCEKVFCFEPCYEKFKAPLLDTIIKNDSRIEIIQKGLWHKREMLDFREELQTKVGSGVVSVKQDYGRPQQIITIETENIDNFVQEKNLKIDFIKMDIENAEMNALKGAEKTLVTQRPQLAVSIYHSNEQFCEIPIYLKTLLKNYEFRLGHYSSCLLETVIYAIPEELIK